MKSSAKKVELAPYDDLFSTEESRQDAKLEKIQEIPLSAVSIMAKLIDGTSDKDIDKLLN